MEENFVDSFKKAVKFSYPHSFFLHPRLKKKRFEIDIERLNFHVSEFLATNNYPKLNVSADQCIKWSYFLEDVVAKLLNMKAWVTVGQLWNGDHHIQNPSWEDCRRYLNSGIHIDDIETGLKLHGWITTQDGTVIDVSFLSTLAKNVGGNWLNLDGKILTPNKECFFSDHKYVPMIVGSDALDRISSKSTIPFLATNANDLYPQTIAILEPVN